MDQEIVNLLRKNSELIQKLTDHLKGLPESGDSAGSRSSHSAEPKAKNEKKLMEATAAELAGELSQVLTQHLTSALKGAGGSAPAADGETPSGGTGGGYSSTARDKQLAKLKQREIEGQWEALLNIERLREDSFETFKTLLTQQITTFFAGPVTEFLSGNMFQQHVSEILRNQSSNVSRMFGDITDAIIHDFSATFGQAGKNIMSFSATVKAITDDLSSGRRTYASYMGSFSEYGMELRSVRKSIDKALGPNGSLYNFADGDTQTELLQTIYSENIRQGRNIALDSKEMRDQAIKRQESLKTIAKFTGQSFEELVKMNAKDTELDDALYRSKMTKEGQNAFREFYTSLTDERQKKLALLSLQSQEFGAGDFKTKIAMEMPEAIGAVGDGNQMAATMAEISAMMERGEKIRLADWHKAMNRNQDYINKNVYSGIAGGFSPTGFEEAMKNSLKLGQDPGEDDANLIARAMNKFRAWVDDSPLASVGKWLSGPAGLINAMMTNTVATHANTVALGGWSFMGLFKPINLMFSRIMSPFNMVGRHLTKLLPALGKTETALGKTLGVFKGIGGLLGKLVVGLGVVLQLFEGFKQILFGPSDKSKERFRDAGLEGDAIGRANLYSGLTKLGFAAALLTPAAPIAAIGILADLLTGGVVTDWIGSMLEHLFTSIGEAIGPEWLSSWEDFKIGLSNLGTLWLNTFKKNLNWALNLIGLQSDLQEQAYKEVKKSGEDMKNKTVETQQKIHKLIWNGTEYMVAPGSQGATKIDLSAANDILKAQADTDQRGYTDAEILSALIDGNRVNKDMLAALQYMASKQGKSLSPAYNTNPDSRRMG